MLFYLYIYVTKICYLSRGAQTFAYSCISCNHLNHVEYRYFHELLFAITCNYLEGVPASDVKTAMLH